jgi:hypothetical protein
MTITTVTDRSALAAALRDLKLSGMLGTVTSYCPSLPWRLGIMSFPWCCVPG